jgi:hypothetical protein
MDLLRWMVDKRVAGLVAAVVLVGFMTPGCGPSSPKTPTTPPTGVSDESETPDEPAETGQVSEIPAPQTPVETPAEPVDPEPVVVPVEIPDGPVAGMIDGQVFVLGNASVHESVVTLTGEGGRSVSVILFDEADGAVDLTGGAWPFGSPHVVLRPGDGKPATTWTDGYRLRLDLKAGELFIKLPEGRGVIAGRFDTQG